MNRLNNKQVEIKILTECQEYIPTLADLWFEEISKHWVPNASVERAKQNLIKHLHKDEIPMTLVAILDGKPIGMASFNWKAAQLKVNLYAHHLLKAQSLLYS